MSNRNKFGRRSFLIASAALATQSPVGIARASDGSKVQLRPGVDNDLFRVRVEISAKGNVNVPRNPLVSRTSDKKLPLQSEAAFDYEERLRRPAGADGASEITVAERYYHEAKNDSLVNRTQRQSELRPSVRETIVHRELLPEVIYGVDDYFSHEELDLLRLPISSVAADRLLPTTGVAVGDTYELSSEVMVSVLNLTSIEASDVRAEVVSITEKTAKIQFRGKADGSVDGVPTVIRLLGKMTFDRLLGTTTWLAMALHETREIGNAEPGFDISATVKMVRKPLARTIALPSKPRAIAIDAPIPRDRLYVELKSDQIGFAALMDRRWRMMTDVPGAAMMRMIDNDRSIAQCDVRPLVALSPGTQWTLEALQQDVRRTLGEQLVEFIEVDQRVSPGGLRVLRVIAQGAVEGVPIQWIVMHFSDDSGRRVLATFTMEGDGVAEFAGSDVQLASSFRLTERVAPQASDGTKTSDEPIRSASRLNARGGGEIEVQSASDLR